jgi:uncharacterized membrane protein YjjP (DUF1212 family)
VDRDDILTAMTLTLRAGQVMLESSVAVSDVEDALRRLVTSLGIPGCEVSITLNLITLSLIDPVFDLPVTMVKAVDLGEPRLDRLVAVEHLNRRIERREIDLDGARRTLDAIEQQDPPYRPVVLFLAAMVSAAAWVYFSGGGWIGVLVATLVAILVRGTGDLVGRSRLPEVFGTAVAAALIVAVPYAFLWAGVDVAVVPAVAGGLYLILPGGALVASVTDGMSGSPISSMAKGVQVVFSALAIAVGVIGALKVVEELDIVGDILLYPQSDLVVALSAGVAVAGLAVSRAMPARFVPTTAAIAVAAWAVLWASPTDGGGHTVGIFLGGTLIGVAGQIVARVQRTTATLFTTNAVYVLVPGSLIYLSMLAFARGDNPLGTELAGEAIRIAVAIAAGIALGVAVGRSVPSPRARVALWRQRGR